MTRLVTWMLVLAIAAALVAPTVAPVELISASSDSMSPTIEAGDLYAIVETDEAEVGDIVTFESPTRGGYVTHRVVWTEGDRYTTKGDANPSTDQAVGAPLVDESDLLGTVVTVGGKPLVLPGAGSALLELQAHRVPLVALGIVIVITSILLGSDRPVQPREVIYVGDLLVPLLVGGVIVSGFVVMWGWSAHEVGFVAVGGQATAARAIPVGESVVRSVTVDTAHPPFTTVFVEAEGMRVVERSVEGSTVTLALELPALETPGPYSGRVEVYAYPATLPRGLLARLHEVHWLAALGGSLGTVFGPLGALYLAFLDGREPVRVSGLRWRRSLRRVLGI